MEYKFLLPQAVSNEKAINNKIILEPFIFSQYTLSFYALLIYLIITQKLIYHLALIKKRFLIILILITFF
jgi:hypothetical protein